MNFDRLQPHQTSSFAIVKMASAAAARCVALVTGSTHGLGYGIARVLASQGNSIILSGLGETNIIEKCWDEISRLVHVFLEFRSTSICYWLTSWEPPADWSIETNEISLFKPNRDIVWIGCVIRERSESKYLDNWFWLVSKIQMAWKSEMLLG